MRIWDQIPPSALCRQHLLAQWREGLGLWNILTQGKKGYANHPETKRWAGHIDALWGVLYDTRDSMLSRGWNPKPMPHYPASLQAPFYPGLIQQPPPPWDNQLAALRAKRCACEVPA